MLIVDMGASHTVVSPERAGLTALDQRGGPRLTHTPSPMGFLAEILGRPRHERAYLLIPVGYPAEGAQVPELRKKALDEVRENV